MAIFHASTKPIARSAGRSSVAAAAYRAGCELVDERTGLIHDYTKKGGVVSTEILTPDGLGVERNELWNAAEAAEKRKDARTAREWIVALPSELNREQRKELAHSFGAKLSERFGVAVDIAIHQPDREGDNRNHHAHILTTTREVGRDETGKIVMGNKATIELSDKARRDRGLMNAADEITIVRQIWEKTANNALEQAGRSERIDHRSLKAQGIDREATTHLGPIATEMERRGIQTDRGDGNRQAHANNQERTKLSAQIIDLQAERERREREVAQKTKESPEQALSRLTEEERQAWRKRESSRLFKEAKEARAEAWRVHAKEPKKAVFGLIATREYTEKWNQWADDVEYYSQRNVDLEKKAQETIEGKSQEESRYERDFSHAAHDKLEREHPELAQERRDKIRAENEKREQERAANNAMIALRGLVASRACRAHGYADGGKKWEALPEALKTQIDGVATFSYQEREVILDRMHQNLKKDPDAAEKLKELVSQGKSRGRGISR